MNAAMFDHLLEILIALTILGGAGFTLVGSIGLLRLYDVFQRMHSPTKATTMGVGLILIASSLTTWLAHREISLHEVLVALLLFVSAPVSAYMVARVALQQGLRTREGASADAPRPPDGEDR
jgi:multicomponent K+:H+ antiporter subunit G